MIYYLRYLLNLMSFCIYNYKHRKTNTVTHRVSAFHFFHLHDEVLMPLITPIATIGYVLRTAVLPGAVASCASPSFLS